MAAYEDTSGRQTNKGGRIRWPIYTERERAILERQFLGDWHNLDFLESFWSPIYDARDLLQYRQIAEVWRLRLSGKTFKSISVELGIDQRKACALVSGRNLHPYLVQMYLNSQVLYEPRDEWKWILECTPKPTNMFPKAFAVPEKIQSYQDILGFLKQFPPIPQNHSVLKFFGLSSEWVELHKAEVFGFLLGFTIGDAGKYFPEYIKSSRHYGKTGFNTNMKMSDSNLRILTYTQLCLSVLGLWSHAISPASGTIRWTSEASSLLTWIFRVCLGLNPKERTSRQPVRMDWLPDCPREFIVAFFQGLAESDGHVDKFGRYADIASKTNSVFFVKLLNNINIVAHAYPKARPKEARMTLRESLKLQLFNPFIKSYRYELMRYHATQKGILPPSPSFS